MRKELIDIKYRKYHDYHKIVDNKEYKQCKHCLQWFEMNLNNFNIVNKNKDGFNDYCITCQKQHDAEYYNRNRNYILNKAKTYEKINYNDGQLKNYFENRYKEQKETILAQQKEYREENKEVVHQRQSHWRQSPIGKEWFRNYSGYHKMHTLTKNEWENCKKYFNYRCAYCGLPIEEHYVAYKGKLRWNDFHKEHAINDGNDDLSNCLPSCRMCNSEKHTDDFDIWYNESNPKYDQERFNKIIQWLTEDYKKYFETQPTIN